MIASGVANEQARLEGLVVDYSYWDEAYRAVMEDDFEWLYPNMGVGAVTGAAIEKIAVAHPDGRIYGWTDGVEGRPADGVVKAETARALEALIADLPVSERVSSSSFFEVDGRIWLMAVARMRPFEAAPQGVSAADLPHQIHAVWMSAERIAALTAPYLAGDVVLSADVAEGRDGAPIKGADGSTLAYLSWPKPTPGYDALLNVGAPIGAALLLAILAVGFSNRFIGRSVVRLERALEAAKAADQSKAAFLATLSHELKTPMNGVLGMVQILKRTELTERQSRIAATIESSADAQLSLINDLLSASKLQHGKFVLENAPFDVVAVAESVAEPSRLLAEEKGLTFRFEAPKSAHRLLGDETAVKQIMTNLASNAVKFTDEGEVSMRLEVDYFGGEAHVSLSVTDSGPGIDPSLHEAIFERFRQANDSLSRTAGGSGLGLAISRDLAALMGGDVAVKSAPGRGSTFVFTVALEGAEGAEADLAA